MLNANLSAIVAQLNAGGNKKPADSAPKPEKKKPAPSKPRTTTKATSSGGGPAGSEDSSQNPQGTKVRVKLKGSKTGYVPPPAAPKPQPSNVIAGTAAVVTAPTLDPTTAPLLKRVKDVLDCLLEHNGEQLTPARIQQLTGQNLAVDTALLREVHRHVRMTYAGAPVAGGASAPAPTSTAAWYAYRPEIPGIRDKTELLNFIRDHKGPALLLDVLSRCYLKAGDDLKALKEDGLIFVLGHPEAGKETVFVRDMMGQDHVSEDVRGLWFEVCQEHITDHLPEGITELQLAVTKAGLRSALAHQPVKRPPPGAPKERAKRPRQQRINIDKATNAHLPFLFAAAQPKMLDG